jgi:hypothetical protein
VDEAMGSMRNGQGDEFFVLFSDAGCFLKGFDHEQAQEAVPPEAFYDQLPEPFRSQAQEVAFSPANVTFCYWRRHSDPDWGRATVPSYLGRDGSGDLLPLLVGDPRDYVEFAQSYHEREVPLGAVSAIYQHQPITMDLAHSLNPSCSWVGLTEDCAEVGYPISIG